MDAAGPRPMFSGDLTRHHVLQNAGWELIEARTSLILPNQTGSKAHSKRQDRPSTVSESKHPG